MNTDVFLSVDGTDFSEYLTENDLRVKYTPVYDKSAEFTALDGSTHRKLLGFSAQLSVTFSALPDEKAKALSALLKKQDYSVTFAFPDERTAMFYTLSLSMEPEHKTGDVTYWSAYLSAVSELLPPDGL